MQRETFSTLSDVQTKHTITRSKELCEAYNPLESDCQDSTKYLVVECRYDFVLQSCFDCPRAGSMAGYKLKNQDSGLPLVP